LNQYEEKILYVQDLYSNSLERKKKSKIEEKYNALIEGIKGFKDNIGMSEYPPVIIGLSGGIDSTIVAALFAEAIGKEKIIGINMPTKYNSEKTKNAAREFAAKLGIKYYVVPIESLVNENTLLLEDKEIFDDGIKLSTTLNKKMFRQR
jgi:NAD+ synthase (glutamine-hydrolysing)